MICKDTRSKLIMKQLNHTNLEEVQEKYIILQFETTGYQNNGYNVATLEVLDKDLAIREEFEKYELKQENVKLKKVINILRRCLTGAYQTNYDNYETFKLAVAHEDITVNTEEYNLVTEVIAEVLKDA